jgi:hypothetical protein
MAQIKTKMMRDLTLRSSPALRSCSKSLLTNVRWCSISREINIKRRPASISRGRIGERIHLTHRCKSLSIGILACTAQSTSAYADQQYSTTAGPEPKKTLSKIKNM